MLNAIIPLNILKIWRAKMQRRKFLKNSAFVVAAGALGGVSLEAKQNQKKSTLMQNDPEFAEFFEYFTKEQVAKHNELDSKTTALVKLGALIATSSVSLYKKMLDDYLSSNELDAISIKELLYQSVPYVGFAKVFDFFKASNEVLAHKGIKLPLEKQGTTTLQNRYEEGLKKQVEIFGESIISSLEAAPKDTKHFREFLSSNCFGDYYTREGLDLKTRELLTFVFIASLGGCEPQLKAHTIGNLNMGNHRGILISAITQICPLIGYPRTLNALGVVEENTKA